MENIDMETSHATKVLRNCNFHLLEDTEKLEVCVCGESYIQRSELHCNSTIIQIIPEIVL